MAGKSIWLVPDLAKLALKQRVPDAGGGTSGEPSASE